MRDAKYTLVEIFPDWLKANTIESSTFLPLTDNRIKEKRCDMEKN